MEINIISFTSEQFSKLTNDQLADVKTAQMKKNRLEMELEREKRALKSKMLKNGMLRSEQYTLLMEELVERYGMEVENVRDGLLFYLQYSMKPSGEAPYTVDYTLSMIDRLGIVRNYYDKNFTDKVQKYQAFTEDIVAVSYLGEFYPALKDYYYYEAYGN